jgi:AmmeMemoRadiSam system protein B/AmmeMemoRadiSam system protein A
MTGCRRIRSSFYKKASDLQILEKAKMDRRSRRPTLLALLLLLSCCTAGNSSEQDATGEAERGKEPPARRGQEGVHTSPIAGSWYPKEPEALRRLLEGALEKAPAPDPTEAGRLIAVVVPHAGYAYSGITAAHAYKWIGQRRPKRILMIGPSHHAAFRGISFGDFESYETPLGRIPVDPVGRKLLETCPLVGFHPEAHGKEHSLDIQVPFLQVIFPESPPSILPLLVGRLEEEDYPTLARCLNELLDNETVLVVSSDFTHYGPRFGYVPFPYEGGVAEKIRHLDQGACDKIVDLDREGFLSYHEATGITVCGCRPIALLLELLPGNARPANLHYATSGQLTGDYRNSVSYYSLAFTRRALWGPEAGASGSRPERGRTMQKANNPPRKSAAGEATLTSAEKATLLRLARDTVEGYVKDRKAPDPRGGPYAITPALREHRGAFVTLKAHGKLRGCVGYIQPIEPLYEAVQQNAINAATRDSRFRPVKSDELSTIEIDISVLTPPAPVSSYQDIVPGRHGIILKKGSHQAVFLPQVASEQGWDLPQTLRHLSLKAGLSGDDWRDPDVEFLVFTAEVVEEE